MDGSLPFVYVIGDSISIQYGPFLEKYLAGKWRYDRKRGEAEALLNLDQPAGANGGDSSMVLEYLRAVFKAGDFRPDLLLVNCGLHDIKTDPATGRRQIDLPAYEKNLREIVRFAADGHVAMAWIRTTAVSDEHHNVINKPPFQRFEKDRASYDEIACRVMRENSVPTIDLPGFTRKLGPDGELFCDHVHFSGPVREKQAAFLAEWLDAWRESRAR